MVVHHSYDDILALVPSLKGLLAVTISVGYRMDLLFILSGFLISYAYISPRQGLTLQAYGRMLRARLSRIYPNYLVIYILTVIGAILCKRLGIGSLGDYPFKAIPVRLAMLQCWPFFTWAMRHWTGPLWFISAIVFAYLFAFPCAWQLVRKPRSPWTLLFWAFAPPALASAASRIPSLHEFHIVLRSCGGFLSGSALFALYFNGSAVIRAAQKHLDKTVVLFVAASALLPVLPSIAERQLVSLLLLLAAPILMAGLTGGSSLTARLLSIRPLAWLASFSYAIYLTHYLDEAFLHAVLPTGRFVNSPFPMKCLVAAVYVIVILTSAMALHRLVEVPCAKALKTFSFTRWSSIFKKGEGSACPQEARVLAKRNS